MLPKPKKLISYLGCEKTLCLPVTINGTKVEMVSSFKCLGVTISNDLSWHVNTDALVRKSLQRLFFLGQLKHFTRNRQTLLNFYHCIIKRILTTSLLEWFGSLTMKECKSPKRIVCQANEIFGVDLPALKALYSSRLLSHATLLLVSLSPFLQAGALMILNAPLLAMHNFFLVQGQIELFQHLKYALYLNMQFSKNLCTFSRL